MSQPSHLPPISWVGAGSLSSNHNSYRDYLPHQQDVIWLECLASLVAENCVLG